MRAAATVWSVCRTGPTSRPDLDSASAHSGYRLSGWAGPGPTVHSPYTAATRTTWTTPRPAFGLSLKGVWVHVDRFDRLTGGALDLWSEAPAVSLVENLSSQDQELSPSWAQPRVAPLGCSDLKLVPLV